MVTFGADTTGADVVEALKDFVDGKTCTCPTLVVITGASEGGYGSETAISLANANPKNIILLARTESKVIPVIEEITNRNPAISVYFVGIDFLDNGSVREAAENIRAITDKIDVLINNAGIMAVRNYGLSKDGIESQFAANYVGHFLLTNLLIKEILAAGNRASIVNVSSLGYQLGEVNLDDPNFKEGKTYNPWHAYGQSKTANILFTYGLAKRLEGKGLAVFALQPGGKPLPPQETVTLQQGAGRILVPALDQSLQGTSPCFLDENRVVGVRGYATDTENVEKLWSLSEKLVRQTFIF
ncbi:hypothetical protein OIDMADRAFT_29732 [Oidiodendron maius Zn]|uniref:Short-chain dehydrogenase n=1 Tax=Oidiodendron maius (strain Zn) TaxID=913774 RepID=A0A0C3HED8_OIDMZ|nr:hypothetical protein OIDMADRAFT_29732 [Oidiodendron maius Zn]